jgi:hypothetical protein
MSLLSMLMCIFFILVAGFAAAESGVERAVIPMMTFALFCVDAICDAIKGTTGGAA